MTLYFTKLITGTMCLGLSLFASANVPSQLHVFKNLMMKSAYITSVMVSNSSCICYKQCFVHPSCLGATYMSAATPATVQESLAAIQAAHMYRPQSCHMSMYHLSYTDLEPPASPMFDNGDVPPAVYHSFLRFSRECSPVYAANDFVTLPDIGCFYFSSTEKNFVDASIDCTKRGGQLATLSTITRFDAVRNYALKNRVNKNLWVDITRSEGEWKWGDHTVMRESEYPSFWREGSKAGGNQDHATLDPINSYKLNDKKGSGTMNYICTQ